MLTAYNQVSIPAFMYAWNGVEKGRDNRIGATGRGRRVSRRSIRPTS